MQHTPPTTSQLSEPSLCGLLPNELIDRLEISPDFRGKQIFEWIHQKSALTFDEMSNLPQQLREVLNERFGSPFSSSITDIKEDTDGTVKIALTLHDGRIIESVLLEDENGRKTACLSSQVGCALACTFCKTGTMGLLRDLSAGEIVEQFLLLQAKYGHIDNIVFMGMGEPMMNLDEVKRSIEIFHHPKGLNIGIRRITISTSGLTDGIDELAEQGPPVRLAVSLITADQKLRESLMPVARTNRLPDLQKSLIRFQQSHHKRITLEYVVFHKRNTRPADVSALKDFLQPLKALVNIIPWNPVEELSFQEPSEQEVQSFVSRLEEAGITLSRRYRRGRGVNGACGQLAVQQNE